MGCDISIAIEEKDHKGKWKEVNVSPYNILPGERYYKAWAFLFNVRNEKEWGYNGHPFERRGLPLGCHIKDLKEDYENTYSDWHSWSYINSNEVENIIWPEDLKDCYFKVFLEYVLPRLSTVTCRETRMIVCFHC